MGADIKKLRTRIKSVDNTQHLTKAMGLVASSKIRRAVEAMNRANQYNAAFEEAVQVLTQCPDCGKSPYMRIREGGRVRILVIAGDRGLAGGYNNNVFRLASVFPEAEFIPIGYRSCDRFHKEKVSSEHFSSNDAAELARTLCEDFAAGLYEHLGILYTVRESTLSQVPKIKWVLPLSKKDGEKRQVIFEPDEVTILNQVVPEYIAGLITAAVRESFASEVTARRAAMDSAGRNAQEMIDKLSIQYNRARQSAITQEITEIVAGSGS